MYTYGIDTLFTSPTNQKAAEENNLSTSYRRTIACRNPYTHPCRNPFHRHTHRGHNRGLSTYLCHSPSHGRRSASFVHHDGRPHTHGNASRRDAGHTDARLGKRVLEDVHMIVEVSMPLLSPRLGGPKYLPGVGVLARPLLACAVDEYCSERRGGAMLLPSQR